MFDLKRPCIDCPFRKGMGERFQLPPGRLREIRDADAFQCHLTVAYREDDSGEETHSQGDRPQQCAGLMAVLHRERWPNQMMRIGQRLGSLDPKQLDPDNEAYARWREVQRAHRGGK